MGGGGPLLFIVYLAKRWASILQSKTLGGGWTVGVGGATAWVGCRVDGEWEGIGLESGLGMGCGVCG